MGCASSAEARGKGRPRSRAPYARTYSLPVDRHGAHGEFSSHTVALRSSTLGFLVLDRAPSTAAAAAEVEEEEEEIAKTSSDDPSNEADSWPGTTIELRRRRRLPPRTPTATPPRAPEIINAWELMEGLEDALRPSIDRSFSFHTTRDPPKPGFLPLDPIVSELDPEILSSFRDALQSPSPPPFSTKDGIFDPRDRSKREIPGIVRARIAAFQERIDARRARANPPNSAKVSPSTRSPPPGAERRVVLYLTTLRGVRRTYEDCWAARAILQSYGARVDERDVSMHGGFKEELKGLLGESFAGKLPRVFVDGEYLGGAEEVRRMHEEGELGRLLLSRCDAAAEKAKGGGTCVGCGDVRFVPCRMCSGSCKVYVEEEEEVRGFRRCPDCNENGLLRCPLCC
ncbi:uncharacterized protein At3g28850-like [Ananas comosus]|uniref:Uncharacterized protein At3g28850-like n=1 Tax=Ananas comosus TaxID=4615 RepID=A0A199VRJ3_ANACO|nr:uncharacterized protein At3g28850-like [Ananas comosus]OAY79310.1 Uncharacterized protein ACMD2_00134 [Ananas comosus]